MSPGGREAYAADARVRMARPGDLDELVALARTSVGLMTTMPRDRAAMEARLAEAVTSVDPGRAVTGDETYLFVLEEDGAVVGLSAIFAVVGRHRPFYNYKVLHLTKTAPELGVRVDAKALHPTNDYTGFAEVGTLFLRPDRRGGGRGRLLSLARLLFIAVHRDRFGDGVMAEMRGWTDAEGRSPFWEAVGRRFFTMELDAADVLSGREFRFIADLLPSYPIYIDLLPDDARAVIGVAHDGARPAMAMLESEGFRDHGYVDVFDAGPCRDAHIDDLRVVREAARGPCTIAAPVDARAEADRRLVATTGLGDFAVVVAPAELGGGTVTIGPETASLLGAAAGDELIAHRPSPTRDGGPATGERPR
ncbi:MAG: arginine N-succinyltransferase [Actinomycetota bacterium]|nr:arginine N-succinyltransferase [Actinomycetota bacterium]